MRQTKIVIPVLPRTIDEIKNLDLDLYQDADIIEWRADFLPLGQILEAAAVFFERFKAFKILFTVRTAKEGGALELSNASYVSLLKGIMFFKPDYVDIEYFSYPEAIKAMDKYRAQIVLSYHNFKEMPEDLTGRLIQMDKENTAFVKAAVMPQRECDVIDLLQITRDMTLEYGPHFVTMGMGELGMISRISGSITGSCWTFSYVGEASAPGQIVISDMVRFLDLFEEK